MKFTHSSGRIITLERTPFSTEVTSYEPGTGFSSMVPMNPGQVDSLYKQLAASQDWIQV